MISIPHSLASEHLEFSCKGRFHVKKFYKLHQTKTIYYAAAEYLNFFLKVATVQLKLILNMVLSFPASRCKN